MATADELPWDTPKPDPDDLDLFAQPAEPDRSADWVNWPPNSATHQDGLWAELRRVALARIAAAPVLDDPPPVMNE